MNNQNLIPSVVHVRLPEKEPSVGTTPTDDNVQPEVIVVLLLDEMEVAIIATAYRSLQRLPVALTYVEGVVEDSLRG